MANGKTLSPDIDTKLLTGILDDLDAFLRAGFAMRKKLSRILPAKYGSDLWWEQTVEQSKKDITAGRYTELKTKEDITRFFDAL
jgi:vancomycin resistance protein YoaR